MHAGERPHRFCGISGRGRGLQLRKRGRHEAERSLWSRHVCGLFPAEVARVPPPGSRFGRSRSVIAEVNTMARNRRLASAALLSAALMSVGMLSKPAEAGARLEDDVEVFADDAGARRAAPVQSAPA